MKFLIIVQDLRISGTSEGIVSRSFLSKLRMAYPKALIDVAYLKHHKNEDRLDLLPVDSIQSFFVNQKIPSHIIWLNKVYWRLFHSTLKKKYILKKYRTILSELDYNKYNHIFIRSSGQEYETILGAKDLPILKEAIINFHDPYPVLWDTGSRISFNKLEFYKLIEMWSVVEQAKGCISPAKLLSEDMEHLYGSSKKFKCLPHQYSNDVFDFSDNKEVRKKNKKIQISYHGAIQFTRNIDVLLDAYVKLISNNSNFKENTEVVLRIKGNQTQRIIEKYSKIENIIILDCLNFANSACEQITQSDILLILENCSTHSNILVGKAPFLAALNKPILCISPFRSELRQILDAKYIATYSNDEEVYTKIESLINERFEKGIDVHPFHNYFGNENFKNMIENVLD